MNQVSELKDLLGRRTWDKEVVLWLGSEPTLKELLAQWNATELDLLDLFDPNDLPSDDDVTRKVLTRAIRSRLQDLRASAGSRIILVVRSCGLLARYGLGLKDFYDWFCGDFGMVVLPLACPADNTRWPESILFEKDRLFKYFSETGMCSRIVTDKG